MDDDADVDERSILMARALIVIAIGASSCVAAVLFVVIPRHLGWLADDPSQTPWTSLGFGIPIRGIGWLVASAVSLLAGAPVLVLGIREYIRERRQQHP